MKSKNLITILLVLIITGLTLWGLMLILTWSDDNPNELLIDLGKTGASLSLITVIGGLVQWILKNRESEKQKENEKINFYRNLLSDLKSVYDGVEKARLLIEAHRTAKTYGEQMRELISGVVTLHNIKRSLNPEFPNLEKELNPCINSMNHFIKELLREYRDHYKRVSILQEIDETKKNILKEENAKITNPDIVENDIPAHAWDQIKKLEKLSILRDDENFDKYRAGFLAHLDKASSIIRQRIPVEEE
jgi:hypothetical protein